MKCKFHSCHKPTPPNPYKGQVPVFCSTKCKNKHGVNVFRRRRKQELVNSKGGKCERCPETDVACLTFHHRDPSKKEYTITRAITLKLETVQKELDKCDLLCFNCHMKHHAY